MPYKGTGVQECVIALSTAVASLGFVGLTVHLMAHLCFSAILTGYKNLQNPRKQRMQMIPGREVPRQPWLLGWGLMGPQQVQTLCLCLATAFLSRAEVVPKSQIEMFSV